MKWTDSARFGVRRRVYHPSPLSHILFDSLTCFSKHLSNTHRVQRALFSVQPMTFHLIQNLFGEGAGIFWDCACVKKYTPVLVGLDQRNTFLKKISLKKEQSCNIQSDHFLSFSVLSSHCPITRSENPSVFWPLLPHPVPPWCCWPQQQTVPGSAGLRCAHKHSELGLHRDHSRLPGDPAAARGRAAQRALIKGYSPPLCLLCQLDLGQAVGQRVFSLLPICRHSSVQFILQATLCRTGAASPIALTALEALGLCTSVHQVERLQPREERGKENCNGRASWKVRGH